MAKSASLNTGGGQTTFTFTCTYDNAKFVEIATIAAEANGITYADLLALSTQDRANWLMNNVVLAAWKRWTSDKARNDALQALTPYDFDGDA